MTEIAGLDAETEDFAQQIADSVSSFLLALKAIAREADAGRAVSLLLLEISQVLLAGARLGAQRDFDPTAEYQPDVGPEPELVESQLSDDLTSIATDLENGLRHYRSGNVEEALWWWQYSYVASWGNLAGAALNALLSVVAHDRLDAEIDGEEERVAAADEMLDAEMLGSQDAAPR